MAPFKTLGQPGGRRSSAASAKASEACAELAIALRRAVPFLARKRLAVTAEPARCASFAELAADPTIVHTTAWSEKGTGARGLVLLDEIALGRLLDGVLGGEGNGTLTSPKLTSAQAALASRVSSAIMRAFGDVLASRLGIEVEACTSKDIEGGVAVLLTLSIEGGGRAMVALPVACVRVDEAASDPHRVDAGIAAAMTEVELDVVAELGKVRLSLEAIARLKVGDVVRLGLPLDERARVSAGGAVLFHGRPTASGEVVAVALERTAS